MIKQLEFDFDFEEEPFYKKYGCNSLEEFKHRQYCIGIEQGRFPGVTVHNLRPASLSMQFFFMTDTKKHEYFTHGFFKKLGR